MISTKRALLSSTVIPLAVVAGVAMADVALSVPALIEPAYATCNPCNPCAAANPCNPCAAANPCNPCNPCAAGGGAVVLECSVPRLVTAAANPCNPCAVKKPCSPCAAAACNPCNPCAAANPCNPCAAKNPCSPCAAAACNPCNPCAAADFVELSDAEAKTAYECLQDEMKAAYAKSDNAVAGVYRSWKTYSTQAYQSATHGGRYVMNFADGRAKSYGDFEKGGPMPVGAQLAKESFAVKANGQVSVGPLFIMEKMQNGFNSDGGDWRYTMIMPTGATAGTTKGAGSQNVEFCIGCHLANAERDSMLFMPEQYRVSKN